MKGHRNDSKLARFLTRLCIAGVCLLSADKGHCACNSPHGQIYTLTVDSLTLYNSAGNEVSTVAYNSTDTYKATAKYSDTLPPTTYTQGASEQDTVQLSWSLSDQASGSGTDTSDDGQHSEDSTSTTLTTPTLTTAGAQSITFTVTGPISDCSATKTISIDVINVQFNKDTTNVAWSKDGTYDATLNLTNSYDTSQFEWALSATVENGNPAATIEDEYDDNPGLVTFGTGGGEYKVTATSDDGELDPEPSATFTLKVIKVAFISNTVNTAWSPNGTYAAANNLTTDTYDTNGMKWTLSPSDATIDISSGLVTFGNDGGSYTITAASTDLASVSAHFTLNVIKVESVELVSGATANNVIPPNTWAAVKNTTSPTQYVIIRAEIKPNLDSAALPAGLITWSGGEPVATDQLEQEVPKNVAAHSELVATCGGSSATGDVWVMWSDITVRSTGNKTPYDAETDTGNDKDFPDYTGGDNLGGENLLAASPRYLGWKVEIEADISPAGVNEVVKEGWDFYQTYTTVDFNNQTNTPASVTNKVDTDFNTPDFKIRVLIRMTIFLRSTVRETSRMWISTTTSQPATSTSMHDGTRRMFLTTLNGGLAKKWPGKARTIQYM